jgi:YaiO family outer membrane protein
MGRHDSKGILDSVTRRITAALTVGCLAAAGLRAQTLRVAAWSSYEGVTNSEDWSTVGAQFTLAAARGNAAWAGGERVGRFGATDLTARVGGVLHPNERWWITVEAGTATEPEFMPKNSWEVDVAALAGRRASLGLGYRRRNYVVGPVDFVIPHAAVQTWTVSWDLRVFLSRNPSQRTDAAFYLRATTSLTPRAAVWVLGAAGKESYLVGTPPTPQVRSLETTTAAAGLRYDAGNGLTLRMDVSVVRSRPVLSRRGVTLGAERGF